MGKRSLILMSLVLLTIVLFLNLFTGVLAKTQVNKIQLIIPISQDANFLGLNQWFPKDDYTPDLKEPQITAKAGYFISTKTGQVLYTKNIHERLPIASLVKVMTALIALEHKSLISAYKVPEKAAEMEPDKMWLQAGEVLTLRELLYGLFMVSANDAAETIAVDTVGGREEFIKLMNSKAIQLGMKDTHYTNPSGWDEDNNDSYSSAYDLAILSRYAIRRFPVLVDISSTYHKTISKADSHESYDLYSDINLLTTYEGVVGLKIGYTPDAGLTIITLARKGDYEVLGVLLGSENRREETRELLDYSFQKLGVKKN